jgi:hypothetical protein
MIALDVGGRLVTRWASVTIDVHVSSGKQWLD